MRHAIRLLFCCFLFSLAACGSGGGESQSAGETCTPGAEGCPCSAGECGRSDDGQPLACVNDVCQLEACPAGDVSCACIGGTQCHGDAVCVDGQCRNEDCIAGTSGCVCNAGSCEVGLQCLGNVCSDHTGLIGGACHDDGTCNENARCDTSAFPAVCVFCDLGTLGCQCDAGVCGTGLSCLNEVCVSDETILNRTIPANPECYTPCQNDVTLEDGTILNCDADGLLVGCLDGRVCDSGECIEPNTARSICATDSECPEFQQCIRGYCYSNCEADSDCADGLGCHMKVCRARCTAGQNDCPDSMLCDAPDNALGFCVARPSASGVTTDIPSGTLELGATSLQFSNVELSNEILIKNRSDRIVTVKFSKVDHAVVDADGTTETKRLSTTGVACTLTECPLWWLEMGTTGNITKNVGVDVQVPAHCENNNSCPRITVRIAGSGVDAVRWRGSLRAQSDLGTQEISLSYVARPEGQWAGKMVYFANFDDDGIDSVDDASGYKRGWLERPRAHIQTGLVPGDIPVANGLIKRWDAFRNGNMGGGWKEMSAVLAATESEQWRWPSVKNECSENGACYLFSDGATGGFPRPYVTNLSAEPIPAGSSVFSMAFNLYTPDAATPGILRGRVVSQTALHYPGNPEVVLRFEQDPTHADNCSPDIFGHCVTFLEAATAPGEPEGLSLEVAVGGRYRKPANEDCAEGYVEHRMPWLVPGFEAHTEVVGGFFKETWCVDSRLPDYTDPVESILPEIRTENRSLARGNPVPDGQVILRRVEVLDGAMIDQTRIFLLFRETYPSFLGGEALKAYGYMLLERRPVDIRRADENGNDIPDDFEGVTPPANLASAAQTEGVQCSESLLAELGVSSVNSANVGSVVNRLINGGAAGPLSEGCNTVEEVHYLCEETGLFNGGAENTSCWGSGAGDTRIACPLESHVVFFTAPAAVRNTIIGHACQDSGTCGSVLATWATSGSVITQLNPAWTCENDAAACDRDPLDRRAEKVFYASASDVVFTGLRPAVADAFRYRTRFQNRDGTSLAFTPSICQSFSNAVPYCYDPAEVESIRDRVDCLVSIFEGIYSGPNGLQPGNAQLFDYLEENFARHEPDDLSGEAPRDGFEKYYAELLIMLGDQAYTNAFESRFDLTGISSAGFQGDEFEVEGIAVSGIAGYEMFTLHQAVQYYSMALDRFYRMSSALSAALDSGTVDSAPNFLSERTVTAYFDRLIRASTQRSRAWAEIARRYQSFNRADLARRVATRAYNATYLESIALANTILRLYDLSQGSDRPSIQRELEEAQRTYSMALLDLAHVYQSITDEVNILGFEPDYVPFPALGTGGANIDINAFERIYQFAQSKLEAARRREDIALSQTREYDSDDASFQAELTRLSRTYEGQLSELCGVFTAPNGTVFPAIEQYAEFHPQYALYGDPCGFVGNGVIHQAIVNLDVARVEMSRVMAEIKNVYERAEIQKTRVQQICDVQEDLAYARFENAGQIFSLDEDIIRSQEQLERVNKVVDTITSVAQTLVCEPTTCLQSTIVAQVISTGALVTTVATIAQQEKARSLREEKAALESAIALETELAQCDIAEAELRAETKSLMLSLRELELTLMASELRAALGLSEVSKSRQQARRIQLEMKEALGLAVNVQAARNNPNVRIYRNDAVLNAEVAFEDALREAYRLTLVYEYYTSQTYAARDQLFLTRMVSAGDYNLENYVADLRNAFLSFEEQFGNPDLRVTQVSLVNDIFRIPRIGENGEALSPNERAARMRALLLDQKLLNEDGYISVPFSTRLTEVSPVTRNHKIFYVEANIEGNETGDFIGRLYLRPRGTSTVHTIDGTESYFRFPQRTAVINPAFNRQRPVELSSSTEVFRSYRLRDLPLVNDHWELIFNQRDEAANLDVNLNELTDIKLYIFYTDFTVY